MASSILIAEDLLTQSDQARRRSRRVREYAEYLAKTFGMGVELVHVEDFHQLGKQLKKQMIQDRMVSLREIQKNLSVHSKPVVLDGTPAEALLKYTKKNKAIRFIAMGTRGYTGLSRVLLGSVVEEVARHAKLPMLILSPKLIEQNTSPAMRKILVATDLGKGKGGSSRAETLALLWAKKQKAELVYVHCLMENLHPVLQTAFTSPSAASQLQSMISKLKKDVQVALKKRVAQAAKSKVSAQYILDDRSASAGVSVLSAAQVSSADWIFMGNRGRNIITQAFLGSTSREAILNAQVPVVIVP